ncbi:hypothetical protein HMPREF1432_00563 [Helicobacter pylori GAMchJs114i]|nr:hypothetical protein HMPREF1392_01431 [Helicobacter pylori GAM101Biv]EMG90838.1 hypothetical protein HMPREF1403_00652 [Helicobacter pylori GAM201Ai]EMG98674.1 hypothetical protein HMPREF1405_01397 [Helicobacter pylori GAM231Ai]EMJ41424.1 hypothetical protein HMPREF1432_00563 [Helicobacter pylori GAMchJs114i]
MFWNNSPPLTPFKIPLTQEDRLRNYRLLFANSLLLIVKMAFS